MMKTTIERLDDTKLRLDVEIPPDVLQEAVDSTLAHMARETRLPGFRPGKVPPQAVLNRYGREAIVAETLKFFIDDWYRAAVMSSGIRPVAPPDVEFPEEGPPKAGESVRFSATVEVAPKPKLPELATLEVDRPKLPDIQKYVDQVMEATLRGAGSLVDSNEPAAEGDEVVVDFHCTVDGERVGGAAAVGYQARLGDGRLLDELEQAIVGATAGSNLEVEVDFPADHPMSQLAGQHATFHLNLREVQRVELPELGDEVARKVSEFDTAAELDEDIRRSINGRLENEIKGIFRGNAVAKLAEASELEEPQALVEQRQQEAYSNLKQQLEQGGMSVESYLDRAGKDMTELFAELESGARDDLRRELCLLALAEDAEVEVTEADLEREVTEHAESTGEDPNVAMQRVVSSGRVDMLKGELLIQRTIDYLVEQVKPVEVDLPTAPTEAELAAEDAAGTQGDDDGTDAGDEAGEGGKG